MKSEASPLIAHLTELRKGLLLCMAVLLVSSCVAYIFAIDIYAVLMHPLADVLTGNDRRMIYTGLTEAFVTYLKLSLFAGAFVSMPFFLYQIWRFVAPGLYLNERKAFMPFLLATPVLFFTGAAFVYFLVIPMAWRFFAGFETMGMAGNLPIQLEARVSEYLSLVMRFILAFGICFQLPVLLMLLGKVGLVSADVLASKRRYAVVVILIAAAVLTPPDVFSQLILAVPLWALFEISILLMRLAEKRVSSSV